MEKKLLPIIAIVVIAVTTMAGGYFNSRHKAHATAAESSLPENITQEYQEALEAIEGDYAGALDLELLGKHSIQGMLRQLDPHSAFFTKAEFDELQTEQRSRIYGIGVSIQKRYDRVYIMSAVPGAPGNRAGLRYGDAIVAIDGQNVEEWSTEQVMHRVRGEKGEEVEITVDRPGVPNPITVRLRRDEVKLPTVRNMFMTGPSGTGYIALTGGFSSKTVEELTAAMTKLKQEGMRQLILDLRGNPGGLLDQAIEVAQRFLPAGQKILEVRGREDRYPERVYEVPENNQPEVMPMVILINRGTASASEVVAGALQDHDRALIVGENSFGKGLVQSVNKLRYGAGLTLTIARYYTPTGRSIQRNYSNVSFYDYYLNRNEDEQGVTGSPRGDGLLTDQGRTVYGGGGIMPDIEVKSPESNSVRGRLFYAIFDFARQLVAGQVNGLRHYRVTETQYKPKLTGDDIDHYALSEDVMAAFRAHISGKAHFNVSDEQFKANSDYILSQMRREIITAAYGPEAGEQIYLADDTQLRKAIESLDQARRMADSWMADNARRAGGDRQ